MGGLDEKKSMETSADANGLREVEKANLTYVQLIDNRMAMEGAAESGFRCLDSVSGKNILAPESSLKSPHYCELLVPYCFASSVCYHRPRCWTTTPARRPGPRGRDRTRWDPLNPAVYSWATIIKDAA